MKYSAYYIQARLIKYFEEKGKASLADIVEKSTPVSLSEDKFVLYIEEAYVELLRNNADKIEKALQLITKNSRLILWNDAEYLEYVRLASRPCDYTLTFSTLDIDAFSEADLAYYKKYANELHTESPFMYIPNIEGTTAKHLLHAIANYLYDKKPNRTIQISTGDRFVDEVISSEKTLDEYALDCYYNANVVLLSDIQFVTKNDIARRTLSDIISYRIRNKTIKKITVLTSNDKSDVSTLRIPIGVSNCGVLEQAEIIDKPWQHMLVAGHAGSGKSNYLHTVLASLLLNYSADQVNLWLSDGGMCEFNRFTDNAPAHIKRVNTNSDSASYIAFVDALEAEIDNRLKYLASVEMTSFYVCHQEVNQCSFPRLVVMIDGFDHFVRCLFDTNHHYVEKMEHIVRRASTCGITFIVSIQEALFLAQHISRSFFELFGIRIATKQSPDSYAVLFGVPTVAMEHNIMLGDAIVNTPTIRKVKLLHLNTQIERLILDCVITSP